MTSESFQQGELRRTINLAGAVALVVGAVIGAGVYVLVSDIAVHAGSAIWLAFTGAMIISLIGVLPLIQLAGALPRAGGGYFFGSRMLGPFAGTLTSWWVVLAGASSTCLVALTLAYSLRSYIPEAFQFTPGIWAMIIVAAFYGIYFFGMTLAMSLQVVFAIQFVSALILYGVFGLGAVDFEIGITPPGGGLALLMGVLVCYSTCMGFQVIAELGEEIKNARRNIPLALLIGGGIVALIYILVSQVFVSAVPYDAALYREMESPLLSTAGAFMSGPLVGYLAVGAFAAGITSLNAAAIALPREIFAQARDGILPPFFAKVTPHTHVPQRAVSAYFGFVLLLLVLAPWLAPKDDAGVPNQTEFFSIMAGIGILVMSAVLCVASLRLPHRFPERYATSYIRFPMGLLWVCTIITVLVSLGFAILMTLELPQVMAYYTGWTLFVATYYKWATRHFVREDWDRIDALPGEDEFIET